MVEMAQDLVLICREVSAKALMREQQGSNDKRNTKYRYEVVHCGLLDVRICGTASGRMTGRKMRDFRMNTSGGPAAGIIQKNYINPRKIRKIMEKCGQGHEM